MIKKGIISALFLVVLSGVVFVVQDSVNAQHTDVFNIDFDKTKKEKVDKMGETGLLDVVETTKYTVIMEKNKLDNNDFTVHDLELFDIPPEDAFKFQWHQVSVKGEQQLNEVQTRSAGGLDCTRARKGSLYWLSNGTKHVIWGIWSYWQCNKDEKTDKAK